MKTLIQKDTCTPVFTAALSTAVKTGSNPSAHQQMAALRWCGVCVCACVCVSKAIHNGILFSHKKE